MEVFLSTRKTQEVATLEIASRVVRAYILDNNLGSSDFAGGEVIDSNGVYIARISYNGRIWTKENDPFTHARNGKPIQYGQKLIRRK